MRYALIDEGGIVAAVAELDNPDAWLHPDDMTVVEAGDFEPDPVHPLIDYIYEDGAFRLDAAGIARREAERPYSPAEAIAIMLRGNVADSEAVRLKPYIPAFDASSAYSEGDLAVRSEKVVRRTSIGWRELG